MNKKRLAKIKESANPLVLLFVGFLTGVTLGFILLPSIIEYNLSEGQKAVNWETLVAGVLGLIGGSFAILAIRHQRRAEQAQRRMAFRLKLKASVKNIQERVNYFLRPNIDGEMFAGHYPESIESSVSLELAQEALANLPETIPDEIISEELDLAHRILRKMLISQKYLFENRYEIKQRNIERNLIQISEQCDEYFALLEN